MSDVKAVKKSKIVLEVSSTGEVFDGPYSTTRRCYGGFKLGAAPDAGFWVAAFEGQTFSRKILAGVTARPEAVDWDGPYDTCPEAMAVLKGQPWPEKPAGVAGMNHQQLKAHADKLGLKVAIGLTSAELLKMIQGPEAA